MRDKEAKITEFSDTFGAMVVTNEMQNERVGTFSIRSEENTTSYDVEDIYKIVKNGSDKQKRKMSRYFAKTNSNYLSILNYYTTLLLYYSILSPKIKDISMQKSKIKKLYDRAEDFIKKLNIQNNCRNIVFKVLRDGIYYGILRTFSDSYVFQDLPTDYCRTEFKDENGIDVVEFNLSYFDSFKTNKERERVLEGFPPEVIRAYRRRSIQRNDNWYELPHDYAIAIYIDSKQPLFTPVILALQRHDEAQDREADRDERQLHKLFINEMPIDKDSNEPIFELPEVREIHKGISGMLNDSYIKAITGFGKMTLEDTQPSNISASSQNNIEKFKETIYDIAGVSSELFNATGNTTLRYAINKDTSMMLSYARMISHWVSYQVNSRFANDKMNFNFEILPITFHNQQDMMGLYIKAGQFGLPKTLSAISIGIPQSDLGSMLFFENEILNLPETLIPFPSSHTSGMMRNNASNIRVTDSVQNSTVEGSGRPNLSEGSRADKTIQNRDSGWGGREGGDH